MAFTFTRVSKDPVTGTEILTATTNTASAAGSFTVGAKPRVVEVQQITTPASYKWTEAMSNGYMTKITSAGTMTTETANGISVAATTSATTGPWTVTLGTGLHTNSATFNIALFY